MPRFVEFTEEEIAQHLAEARTRFDALPPEERAKICAIGVDSGYMVDDDGKRILRDIGGTQAA